MSEQAMDDDDHSSAAADELTPNEGDEGPEGDDLFGDEVEEDVSDGDAEHSKKARELDDEQLDSGDDEERQDRAAKNDETATDTEQLSFMQTNLTRHAIPEPSDNELYLLKVPRFLEIEPVAWRHQAFVPPTTEHHTKEPPSSTFSAYNTAMSTIRWRHSPRNHSVLQSNARVLRWSDGSLTFQLATNPTLQYECDGHPLAPRQRNPRKPTPTSVQDRKSRANMAGTHYNPNQDSFTYLASPFSSASVMRITNKITAGLTLHPSADTADDALERLQNSLAAAVRGKNLNPDGGISLLSTNEDPELAQKKAEVAEKEKVKAQRRREALETRERDRANRVLGRSGQRAGGLTVGTLEDDELGMGTSGGRARGSRPKPRRQRRDDYSDDEGYGRRKTKEDEYDEEDEFIARSDEEEEVGADDDEEDEEELDDDDEGREKAGKQGRRTKDKDSPKRGRKDDEATEEATEDGGQAAARTKRRRVVEDDEEDE